MVGVTRWKTLPIKELYDGLYDGPHATPRPTDSGPVFLGIKNVTDDGCLDLSEIRHIAEEDYASWTRRVEPRTNDLVFTYEATLNRYAVIPPGFRGCLGRRMALIRTNPLKVDVRFLLYYFFTDEWRAVIRRNMLTGATVDRIPLTTFPDFPVRVPPLSIQQRIAGILSAYDELIENSQRRIRILESMARALYREWFVHFRFPGHENHPRVASPLGEIPQGWEVNRLDEVCRSIQDGDWIETKDQGGEEYRLLQISNLGVGEFIETGNFRYVTQKTFDRLRCNEIVPGDLLVARMPTPIGRGWLVTKMPWRMITAVDVAIIRAEPTVIHPLFLLQAWNEHSNLQRIAGQASGTTRLRITRRDLAAMEFVIPPVPVQQRFAEIVQPQSATIDALRKQIENLRRTRDLLLPRLFSGQIGVEAIPDPDSLFANSESGREVST